MESYVMVLGIILCLLASGQRIDSGRIKRQDSGDFGLAFVTVDTKPSQEVNIGNNHFVGSSLTGKSILVNALDDEQAKAFGVDSFGNNFGVEQVNAFPANSFSGNNFATNSFGSTNFGVDQVNTFSLETGNSPPRPRPRKTENKIPGRPGVDYPMLDKVPPTNFKCSDTPAIPGMYANIETGCQAYHVCHDGRDGPQGASFLCTNGTLFNQKEFICDWWYNVDCGLSLLYYGLNLDPLKNPYTKTERERELRRFHELQNNQFNQFSQQ